VEVGKLCWRGDDFTLDIKSEVLVGSGNFLCGWWLGPDSGRAQQHKLREAGGKSTGPRQPEVQDPRRGRRRVWSQDVLEAERTKCSRREHL
jgi:hypothetical protein